MRFEWDDSKAEKNLRKHGVRLADAVGVFLDAHAVEFVDEKHSSDTESHYAVIGLCCPPASSTWSSRNRSPM